MAPAPRLRFPNERTISNLAFGDQAILLNFNLNSIFIEICKKKVEVEVGR